jgi:hypothetical protein
VKPSRSAEISRGAEALRHRDNDATVAQRRVIVKQRGAIVK